MRADPRLETGSFYTPPGVADLALGLAIRDPADRVWDPTCGDGAFLRRALGRGHRADLLAGHDLDGAALAAARAAVPGAGISRADLFSLDPRDVGPFDAIAGNPPFVRNERIPASRKEEIRSLVARGLGWEPPARADLSVLALLHCLRFLAPGGRLAFVMPNTWMDVASAAPIRRWLLEHADLLAVVESRIEPWFPAAKVNTVIIAFQARGAPVPAPVPAFAGCLAPASADLAAALLDPSRDHPGLAVRRRDPGSDRWSPLLRAPDSWFEVLAEAGPSLVRLGDPERPLLRLAYGTKPGITEFFCPDRAKLDRFSVEPSFLHPFLRNLRSVTGYRVTAPEVNGVIFRCPCEPDPAEHPGAVAWIRRGEAGQTARGVPWPLVPSVRMNHPWYRLREIPGGDVIVPQFRAGRHSVIDNPDHVAVNNSAWCGTWVDPSLREPGVALLNTTWAALAAEVLGRVNLGEGLLTCYGPDLGEFPLPDPRLFMGTSVGGRLLAAWRTMRERKVLPLAQEIRMPDRAELDAAALDGLGLAPALARRIRQDAARLCAERLALAAALRRARGAWPATAGTA